MRRLFLFAAFLNDGVAGEGLLHYLRSLSSLGDIVFVSDNDIADTALDSVRPFVCHAFSVRHGEYDFGSYKRAWTWAKQNLKREDYDAVYLVNDSVFGPLADLPPYLERMESSGTEASCMVSFPGGHNPHMQSWFICFRPEIFLSPWFDAFLLSIRGEDDKASVCQKYETGLSKLVTEKGYSYSSLFEAPHKSIYNSPLKLFRQGMPFVKKSSFIRHAGSLGFQVRRILENSPLPARAAILSEAAQIWGGQYADELMKTGRLYAAKRYLKYLAGKISGR